MILTNKPRHFKATSVFETALTDCHGLVATVMRARLRHKTTKYCSYKNFDDELFR